MSPKCEVASLSSLALYNIVTQVMHALSDDEGLHYKEVTEYHKYTPPEILEDMLTEILSYENLDAGTRFSCLQVFLQNNIRKLETGIFPHSYYGRIMETILFNGTGLMQLNLKGVWMKDNPKLLNNVLTNLNKLKVLHIPHMADNEILQTVANCKTLKVLDVSGECNFTYQGLTDFADILRLNKSQIKILDIGSFGEESIPHEIIAEIIEALPNLASLCSYSFVGKSLLYLYKKNNSFICKLKHLHDTTTTPEICEAIIKTCPHLENLYFDSPNENVIVLINKFTELNKLKLSNFQCSELQSLLSTWTNYSSLRTLKLSLGRGIFDFSIIGKCTNLIHLELYKMEFITHTAQLPFMTLQHLEVTYCDMTSACLKYILEQSPQLRKIAVGEPVKLTDGDLYRLCADLCLMGLEQLWFANARYLTVNAVELLMGHCPHLRAIGQMTGWNIAPGDVDFMRAICQSTNTDLTLLPLNAY